MISIVYVTSRVDPKIEWFFDSLDYQTSQDEKDNEIEIIIIDRLLDDEGATERRMAIAGKMRDRFKYHHVAPKPCSWQGSARLTKQDWFAASNARNTGIIYAQGDYIVFLDDLSVLTGTWWKAVKEATGSGKVTCGAYRKVKELRVENGNITYFVNHEKGIDNRTLFGSEHGPVSCPGQWLYGCSFVAPAQALIEVNGFDEACDGMGFEDCIMGIRLANRGVAFQYDRRMMSYESEELHHIDATMKRTDKGQSPNDKSHAILALAQRTAIAENAHFGPEGLAGLRATLHKTGSLPRLTLPTTDWFDGQLIEEMV